MDPELARILKKLAKDFVNQTAEHLLGDKTPSQKRPQKPKRRLR